MVEAPAGKQLNWHCSFCEQGMIKIKAKIDRLGEQMVGISTKQQTFEQTLSEINMDLTENKGKQREFEGRLGHVEATSVTMKEDFDKSVVISEQVRERLGELEARMLNFEEQMVPQVNIRVKTVEENIAEMKTKVRDEVTEQVQQVGLSYKYILTGSAGGNTNTGTQSRSEEIVKETTSKIQDRLNRLNNIVMYNAPEECYANMNLYLREEKIKHDKLIVVKLCSEVGVDCKNEDISEIRRLGKYVPLTVENNVKPRPILVTLENVIKEKVLRNAYKLKDSSCDISTKIGVSHDMSKEERTRDMLLKQEALKKNQEARGTEFFYVVRGLPWEREVVRIRKRTQNTVRKGVAVPATVGVASEDKLNGGQIPKAEVNRAIGDPEETVEDSGRERL
ncbi:hypothetical protein Pmani_017005 [Petrolisthes manimaculis]|uniref:Uncharacterized protein n=1 Tax=Petrolisthes manimaculis TaxID=1843537 RepID=A0AAE1PNG5_9EUCA|nr:hypothetical protein Pmani_017005 [Petrolisthes manimaculis]